MKEMYRMKAGKARSMKGGKSDFFSRDWHGKKNPGE
jgi:hypothetical protein